MEQGTSGRSEFGDFLHDDSISLELDPKMAQDDFNNLAVLLWFDNGMQNYFTTRIIFLLFLGRPNGENNVCVKKNYNLIFLQG